MLEASMPTRLNQAAFLSYTSPTTNPAPICPLIAERAA